MNKHFILHLKNGKTSGTSYKQYNQLQRGVICRCFIDLFQQIKKINKRCVTAQPIQMWHISITTNGGLNLTDDDIAKMVAMIYVHDTAYINRMMDDYTNAMHVARLWLELHPGEAPPEYNDVIKLIQSGDWTKINTPDFDDLMQFITDIPGSLDEVFQHAHENY